MINIYEYIQKNVNFEIIYADKNNNQYKFTTQIFEVLADKIKAVVPISINIDFNIIEPYTKLEANFYTDNGVFFSEMNYLFSDEDYVYLSFPYNNKFCQRRERKRIPMHIDCELNIINTGHGVLEKQLIKTKNVSASGIACLTEEPLEDFENAKLLMHIPDNEDITVFCRKVYTKEIETDNKILYLNGICFTDISKNDTRILLKACMKFQFDSQHGERIFEEL